MKHCSLFVYTILLSLAECNAGYYSGDSTSCTECAQGTYKTGLGNADNLCVTCPGAAVITTVGTGSTQQADCGKFSFVIGCILCMTTIIVLGIKIWSKLSCK